MTVNYQLIVSSVSAGTFFRLLFRWRGSIWKSVITELSIWLVCYYLIFFCYRFLATASFQTFLEHLMNHMDDRLKYIPLTFMLGFFVTTVFERWRAIMTALPFIESVAISTSMLVPGLTEEARLIRRAIIRYVVLSQVLVFRDISMRVRRRFPNILSLVEAGFLEESELDDLEAVHARPGNRYWVPMNWANSIILEAHQNKIIDQPTAFNNLILALKEFRISLETLCKYDWIPIPIAYPQVVFLAVRVYFCCVSF
ncbi:unnamed protein product [Caenorhabditis auriculariae]|uniref:Bestrophin homolog n=1 Tax=Caenorhabditis auriculariae TaxID=2777116 RepID=A0A8S1HU31_9PELO|nr:unnamed protein product [Caenorhabditis auriculariae]